MCPRCSHLETRLADWRSKVDVIQERLCTNLRKARMHHSEFVRVCCELITIEVQVESFVEACKARNSKRRRMWIGVCVK